MFNFNYLLSSFPRMSLFPAANFNREVSLSHASSSNCGHEDHGDLDAKKNKNNKKKKGRHTKIWTARGVRDRRVRLSMEVSRKFFGLHDALGYDTASNTLEWLISKSSNAIEEVKLANEVWPGVGQFASTANAPMVRDPSGCNRTEKEARRECRTRARLRARERTQAKKNHHHVSCNSQYWLDFLPRKSIAITTSDPGNKFVSLGLRSLEYAMEPPANVSRDQVALKSNLLF